MDCRKWQSAFLAKLRALLGPHAPPAKWKTVVRQAVDLDDHRREDLLLEADGHPPLPVYLLLPRQKTEKALPGIANPAFRAGVQDDIEALEKALGSVNARR